jgi:23S rRNA pseudouridine1911/1915/1917 synthase
LDIDKTVKFIVEKADQGSRLDKYLAVKLAEQSSRAEIKKLIEKGSVSLNQSVPKPKQKLKTGDSVIIKFEKTQSLSELSAVNIPLDIIFEDEYLIAVNKPAGLVVHPAAGHHDDTLVNALAFYCKELSDLNGPDRLGIVHRLDKDTSGVIIIAKDNKTHRNLANQFKKHTIEKTYLAIVQGSVNFDEGVIDAPLSRNPLNRKKMSINYAGTRQAVTGYRVLKRSDRLTLLEAYPRTGRTHQIRVHMANLGHPILGDNTYNQGKGLKGLISRQALHALSIRLKHPGNRQKIEFKAKIPKDIQAVIKQFGLK